MTEEVTEAPKVPAKLYMEAEDLVRINTNTDKNRLFQKDIEITKLNLLVIDLQKKLLEINGAKLTQEHSDFQKESQGFLIGLSEKYSIPSGKWSYDPDTGEITTTDSK